MSQYKCVIKSIVRDFDILKAALAKRRSVVCETLAPTRYALTPFVEMKHPLSLTLTFICNSLILAVISIPADDTENDLKYFISIFTPLAEMFLTKHSRRARGIF